MKTLPGIREGVEQETWEVASAYVTRVAEAISALADQVDEATALLYRITG